jgi:ribosomal protein L39E
MQYIELDSAAEKSLAPHRLPAWLIYSQNERGLVSLRCVATEPWIVRKYVKAIRELPGVVRVWTEKTVTNHLFAEMFMEQNYPTPGLLQQTGF